MRYLHSILAFIFPYAVPKTVKEKADAQSFSAATDAFINSADWSQETGTALEQANRIMDGELERRKTAEAKATTYLAVLAALVPVTLSVEAAEWEKKVGPAPESLRLIILIIAVIYTAAAGWHAFRTLQVAGVSVIGVHDLAKAWQTKMGPKRLALSTALHIKMSQEAINAKVTSIKVTHAHLLRAFMFFILLLLLDPLAYQAQALGLIAKAKSAEKSEELAACDKAHPALASSRPVTPTTTTVQPVPTPALVVTVHPPRPHSKLRHRTRGTDRTCKPTDGGYLPEESSSDRVVREN